MKKFKNDIILIIIILIFAISFYFIFNAINNKDNLVCKIYQEQELKYEIALDHDEEITLNTIDGKIVISINKDGVYVKESDCKDKTCMNQGKINKGGQVITCLPDKIYIKLEGKGADVYL